MSEADAITLIGQLGFPIAVSVYLLYERTKTFKETKEQETKDRTVLIEIIKSNTVANTELKSVIQKLCELVGDGK